MVNPVYLDLQVQMEVYKYIGIALYITEQKILGNLIFLYDSVITGSSYIYPTVSPRSTLISNITTTKTANSNSNFSGRIYLFFSSAILQLWKVKREENFQNTRERHKFYYTHGELYEICTINQY